MEIARSRVGQFLPLEADGYACTTEQLLDVLLAAVVGKETIEQVSADLNIKVGAETIRGYFNEQLQVENLFELQESIDTTTSSGKLVFHIFAALAEFERNLIRERTNAGLAAARARGRLGGRKKSLNAKERKRAVEMYERKNQTVKQICEMMNITKPTLYAYIREEQTIKKTKP